MSESVGSIRVELLARVGDGEPQSMGTVLVPISIQSVSTGILQIDVHNMISYVGECFKAVFADPSSIDKDVE